MRLLVFARLASTLFATTSLPAMAATLAPAGMKTYKAWSLVCDNLGACVVLGTADSDDLLYLRIARPAGATAAPSVKLVLVSQDALKGTTPAFRLTAVEADRTTPLGPYPAALAKDETGTVATTIDGTESLKLIDTIRNAASLDATVLDHKGKFSLDGLSAALRDVDARQGRAGTPTALVAKGMTPTGQVPDPATPPTVEAAPEGSVTPIDKPTLSASLAATAVAAGCDPDVVKEHEGLAAWRLGPHQILTAVPCSGGAYNFTGALYLDDGDGGAAKPLRLPQPPGPPSDDPPNMLVNQDFDPKTMVLSSFAKGRGISDCGSITDWLWTGRDFALLDASALEACPGALAEDWPSLYKADRK